jgi:hypothetical protein
MFSLGPEPALRGPVYFNSPYVIFYEIMNSFVLWSQRLTQINIRKYKHACFNYHSALQPLVLHSVYRSVKESHTSLNAITNLLLSLFSWNYLPINSWLSR